MTGPPPTTVGNDGATAIDVSFDVARLDIDLIHRFLSTEAYWSPGIPRSVVERAIAHSICIGAYASEHAHDGTSRDAVGRPCGGAGEDAQVGFARLVTDRATFACLADVFVVPSTRGRGIAARMVRALLGCDDVQGLRRILLFTADAHRLYERFGFAALARPERAMEIARPSCYIDQPGA